MIDFFNRRKLDELEAENESLKSDVEVLRSENERLKSDVETLRSENKRLTAKLRGDRVCDGCCAVCKHGVLTPTWFPTPMTSVNAFVCELECKCKDFERAH